MSQYESPTVINGYEKELYEIKYYFLNWLRTRLFSYILVSCLNYNKLVRCFNRQPLNFFSIKGEK